ncbi:hypothetical protein RCH06_000318 [Polaromonas sp. CG_9.5]|uniref:hypothetical protein n=1 Tax=Polaromonas sp. CG_9.5 TaxID=3071705 RepID=UPI002E0563F3|nr:hypothetical protein [Polaromonas sp. CG_9.5]
MISGIRVFDTILSTHKNGDSTIRNSADFWRTFCAASGWRFTYERVHSLADIEYFFKNYIEEDVIIFSGHVCKADGFILSNGEIINGTNNFIVNPKNHEKIIIFSSCFIGGNKKLAEKIKSFFGAKYLFAYQQIVEDRFCFLNESILLMMMNRNNRTTFTENKFLNFQLQTDFMKNMNKSGVKNHPLLMF